MNKLTLIGAALSLTGTVMAQNVGISENNPNSKLDIIQTETTGNSIEVNHNPNTNGSSAVWIRNSGTGRALHAQNLLGTNAIEVGRFLQLGQAATSHGVLIDMVPATNVSASGLFVNQAGNGLGAYLQLGATNTSSGVYVSHAGSGDGITNFQTGTGIGLYNDATGGIGIFNVHRSGIVGQVDLLTDNGGIGNYIDLGTNGGTGVTVIGVDNIGAPTTGGDIYAYDGQVYTQTATVGNIVSGAVVAGEQYGVGHGILINHSGTLGRGAEFNITNAANTDPSLFTINSGTGAAIVGQNQNNTIVGTIEVADFAYTGTDVADHVGVSGNSVPVAGWGIGVLGTGGWYGIFSNGDLTATGAKAFTIDHPADPENKMLKHFAIESNEVLNMYRGVAVLNDNGEATIELPDYFDLINTNVSYQLTAIGTPVQPYVLTEVQGNTFEVAGEPGTKVSWVVYADRNDPYMQQNPDRGEDVVQKTGERQGKYLQPELYGKPATDGMFYNEDLYNATHSERGGSSIDQDAVNEIRGKGANTAVKVLEISNEDDEY
jgi:hypothetical protein